jgi:hypothetical protein
MSELTQSPQWLDLSRIAELTQCPYSVLRRYAEQEEVKRALGAANLPGTKGVRWPVASLETWQNMVAAHKAGKITPKTAAAFLSDKEAIVVLPQSGTELSQIGNDAIGLLARLVELHEAKTTPPPDNLLTLKEAKTEFPNVSLSILRNLRVKSGSRLYVKRSAIYAYIQSL